MIQIRNALITDLNSILEIVNREIIYGTAFWMTKVRTYDEQLVWFENHEKEGFPIFVAVNEQQKILGFATYGHFRAYDGYKHTVEHSVYLIPEAQGRGLGKKLMKHLMNYACQNNVHVMVAAITANNQASIRLHEWFGFKHAGILPQTGIKFEKWLDLLFMYKIINSDH